MREEDWSDEGSITPDLLLLRGPPCYCSHMHMNIPKSFAGTHTHKDTHEHQYTLSLP